MKKLWVVESRTKGKCTWKQEHYCPSKSTAVFMIGRTFEEGKKYRIIEMELAGEKLFFSDLFCGRYDENGIRVFGETLR